MSPSDLASLPAGAEPSERTTHARWLFSGLPRSYDAMAEALSFGQNGRWRRFLASRVAEVGTGLDVATGTAHVAIELARRSRGSFVGLDQSEPMLREGRERLARAGFSERVRLVAGTADRLPFADGSFDAVTFTYLLRYVDEPSSTLAELARVVRPAGTLANLEFHVPSRAWWRGLWTAYTRVVMPVAGRLVSRSWYDVGRFLGPSISEFYRRLPLDAQLDLWRAAGITDVQARVMSLGGAVVIWGRKGSGR